MATKRAPGSPGIGAALTIVFRPRARTDVAGTRACEKKCKINALHM
jgi:hypothetical protein